MFTCHSFETSFIFPYYFYKSRCAIQFGSLFKKNLLAVYLEIFVHVSEYVPATNANYTTNINEYC